MTAIAKFTGGPLDGETHEIEDATFEKRTYVLRSSQPAGFLAAGGNGLVSNVHAAVYVRDHPPHLPGDFIRYKFNRWEEA
jgi:diacylglycerol kinase family enzyme